MVIAMVLCAGVAFVHTKENSIPFYKTSAMLYVNTAAEMGSMGVSVAYVGRGGELIETYNMILNTRDTLQEISDVANCGYSAGQLSGKISCSGVGETDAIRVSVVDTDPVIAKEVADAVTKVLPDKIAEFIDGTSVTVLDTATVPTAPFTPNYRGGMMKGAMFGLFISGGLLVLRILLEKKITSVDYLKDTYGDIPVLAVIPAIEAKKSK